MASVFAWADETLDVSTDRDIRMASVLWVSGDFFPALGVEPAFGRLLGSSDDVRGCGRGSGVVSRPDAQRAMSKRAGSTLGEVKGSHAVYVSQPKAVADLIATAANGMALTTR